jgi:hypothetical protein
MRLPPELPDEVFRPMTHEQWRRRFGVHSLARFAHYCWRSGLRATAREQIATCSRSQTSTALLANEGPILLTFAENGAEAMLTLGENGLTIFDRRSQSGCPAHHT